MFLMLTVFANVFSMFPNCTVSMVVIGPEQITLHWKYCQVQI